MFENGLIKDWGLRVYDNNDLDWVYKSRNYNEVMHLQEDYMHYLERLQQSNQLCLWQITPPEILPLMAVDVGRGVKRCYIPDIEGEFIAEVRYPLEKDLPIQAYDNQKCQLTLRFPGTDILSVYAVRVQWWEVTTDRKIDLKKVELSLNRLLYLVHRLRDLKLEDHLIPWRKEGELQYAICRQVINYWNKQNLNCLTNLHVDGLRNRYYTKEQSYQNESEILDFFEPISLSYSVMKEKIDNVRDHINKIKNLKHVTLAKKWQKILKEVP